MTSINHTANQRPFVVDACPVRLPLFRFRFWDVRSPTPSRREIIAPDERSARQMLSGGFLLMFSARIRQEVSHA
ncbi:host cell division inhibitor Icd-like protein [Leminorella grimontii]|uniref:host cell division inhibitor Icd-like protein n=1 Tax=Leminorella grimontii TaxID=82981 RepID=UPI00321F6271